MATCDRQTPFAELDLPPEFEDLSGLLEADLRAIVSMLTTRAHERLLLTRREFGRLQEDLWNQLTEAVNEAMAPLSAETR